MTFVGKDVRRVYSLVKSGTSGEDAYADLVLNNPQDPRVETSKVIFDDDTYRKYLESCLLATEDLPEISELLGIELEVVQFYSKVYYDVSGLSVLQKVKLVQSCIDQEEKRLKLWAVSQGLKFLAWRLGFKVEISPVDGVRSIYSDSFFKAKEAFFNGNTVDASREALKWAKMAMDSAKLLKSWVTDMDAANEELELALREVTANDIEYGNISEIYEQNGEDFIESSVGDSIDQILKENASAE